ncbi:MAG: outer membrane beta-barrel protein [Bacteroidota bacterium]
MKKILFAAVVLVTGLSLKAQVTYHVKVGAQNSNWNGNGMQALDKLVDLGGDYLKQGSFTSFYAGASATIPIAPRFSIEPGLQYSKVGASLSGNLVFKALSLLGVNASARAISHRVEMPVLLKAEVANGLFLVAGPQVNFSYNNQLQLRAGILGINALNKKVDINNMYEPFSAAALGGLQYEFPGGMQVQALYEYGISKIVNNGSMDIRQNNMKIGIGIPLNFLNRTRESY